MVANIPFYNAGHLYSPLGMKIYNNNKNNNITLIFKDNTAPPWITQKPCKEVTFSFLLISFLKKIKYGNIKLLVNSTKYINHKGIKSILFNFI